MRDRGNARGGGTYPEDEVLLLPVGGAPESRGVEGHEAGDRELRRGARVRRRRRLLAAQRDAGPEQGEQEEEEARGRRRRSGRSRHWREPARRWRVLLRCHCCCSSPGARRAPVSWRPPCARAVAVPWTWQWQAPGQDWCVEAKGLDGTSVLKGKTRRERPGDPQGRGQFGKVRR